METERNLGDRTNQNFVQIPFDTLKQKLKHKLDARGIAFELVPNPTRRNARSMTRNLSNITTSTLASVSSLFEASDVIRYNADVNDAGNMARKATGKSNLDLFESDESVERTVDTPRRICLPDMGDPRQKPLPQGANASPQTSSRGSSLTANSVKDRRYFTTDPVYSIQRSMSFERTLLGEDQQTKDELSDIQTGARGIGVLNALIGIIGFAGPAVKGNDDRGLINMKPGLFLGLVAVNAGHNLLHIMFGVLGVQASRNAESSYQYMGFCTAFFGLFSAAVWKEVKFDRDIHIIGGVAMNWWANLGHILLSAFSFLTVIQSDSQ